MKLSPSLVEIELKFEVVFDFGAPMGYFWVQYGVQKLFLGPLT